MKLSIEHPTIGKQPQMNFSAVHVNGVVVYFSYKTPIAFYTKSGELFISENNWNTTTGRHLNYIDSDKKKRIPHSEFLRKYDTHQL